MASVGEGVDIQQGTVAATERFSQHHIDLHCSKCVHRTGGASERTRICKAGAIYFITHSGKETYAVASGNLRPVAAWVCFGKAKYSNEMRDRAVPIASEDCVDYDERSHISGRFCVGEPEPETQVHAKTCSAIGSLKDRSFSCE